MNHETISKFYIMQKYKLLENLLKFVFIYEEKMKLSSTNYAIKFSYMFQLQMFLKAYRLLNES